MKIRATVNGNVLDLPEEEARRLLALGNGGVFESLEPAPAPATAEPDPPRRKPGRPRKSP